ncbi:MAG: glycosyltransferase family 4 protein [Planctomycetaceae bacterium]
MKLAFCLFKFFPWGGLQRDFLRVAGMCRARGHEIDVFTMEWDGDPPAGMNVTEFPPWGMSNHTQCRRFAAQVAEALGHSDYDAVIGFNKMPGLDVYFGGDPCYMASFSRGSQRLVRWSDRYRTYCEFEEAVFGRHSRTQILLLSEVEKPKFEACYGTQPERFHVLPPGLVPERIAPPNAEEIRVRTRRRHGLVEDDLLLMMVGSGFHTKGLDRSLKAIAHLPEELRRRSRLYVIGRGKTGPFLRLAGRLGVSDRVHLLGGRHDVLPFLLAADLLLHPSYMENTGGVLIEAMAAGLPILASDVCGYRGHIERAQAGYLVPSPFRQQTFEHLLEEMLTSPRREEWQRNGLAYVGRTDVFSMHDRAVELIERTALRRNAA